MRTIEQRFWVKVNKTKTCWLWLGSKGQWGHGQFWDGKRLVNAHRVSYEWNVGTIPTGLTIDHICRNPPCVNPQHLQAITMRDNILLGSKAQNTHCPKGHLFEGRNLIWNGTSRMCRICKQAKDRVRWEKIKDSRNAVRREAWRKSKGA